MAKTLDARKFQHWDEDEDAPYTQYFETARVDNSGGKFISLKDPHGDSEVFPSIVLPINPRPTRGNSESPWRSRQHKISGSAHEPVSRKSIDLKEPNVKSSDDPRRSPGAFHGPASSINLRAAARSKPNQEVHMTEQQPSRRSSDFIWRDVAARKLGDQQERDLKTAGDYNHGAYRNHNHHRRQEKPGYKGADSSPTRGRGLSSEGGVAMSPHKSRRKHEPHMRETVSGGWDESGPSSSNSYHRVPEKARTERIAAANVPAILANRPQAIGLKLAQRDTSPNYVPATRASRSQANGHKPIERDMSPDDVPVVVPASRPQAIDHKLAKRGSNPNAPAKPDVRPQANGQKVAQRDTSPKCKSCFCFSEPGY